MLLVLVSMAQAEEAPPPAPPPPPEGFATRLADPRRGLLWAGAAPMDAGTGRLGAGVAGGWYAKWKGLQVAGTGAEVDAAWAPTRRLAFTVTAGVATGGVRPAGAETFLALTPASAWGGVASARYLVVDGPRARVAPFVGGGFASGTGNDAPVAIVGGGIAAELPFYDVVFDIALPLGGVVVAGVLPDTVPLAEGGFAPLFLLGEAGFTWRIGPYTSARLGYIALGTAYSWRYHRGPLTVEVSWSTSILSANLSTRVGWAF